MRSDHSAEGAGRGILIGLILLALSLRLFWGLSRPVSLDALKALPDQIEYVTLARNLLAGQGFSFVDPRFGDRVYAFRMPGYPLFVAGCGGNVQIVRIVQALLDTSSVAAAYVLARLLIPDIRRRTANIAAAIVALNPLLIYFSGMVLSETLFVAMLMWGMALMLAGFGSGHRGGKARVWIAGGALLALAVLVRPSAGLLPLVLGLGALFANPPPRSAYQSSIPLDRVGRWPLPVGTTLLLLVALALLPWALRNYGVLHHLVWTDTNAGITLYDGYNPDATGGSDQRFVMRMPQLRLMDELGRSEYLRIRAFDFIKQHPRRVGQLVVARIVRTWSPVPLSEQFSDARYKLILLLYALPFGACVIAGLWVGPLRRSAKLFLLLPAIYLTLVHGLTVGSLRYRVPAEPALAVLAASCFAPMRNWKRANPEFIR